MTKPQIQIGNTIREMDDSEYAQWQADKIETEAQVEVAKAKAEARQAVLNKLGLTADEAAALLG